MDQEPNEEQGDETTHPVQHLAASQMRDEGLQLVVDAYGTGEFIRCMHRPDAEVINKVKAVLEKDGLILQGVIVVQEPIALTEARGIFQQRTVLVLDCNEPLGEFVPLDVGPCADKLHMAFSRWTHRRVPSESGVFNIDVAAFKPRLQSLVDEPLTIHQLEGIDRPPHDHAGGSSLAASAETADRVSLVVLVLEPPDHWQLAVEEIEKVDEVARLCFQHTEADAQRVPDAEGVLRKFVNLMEKNRKVTAFKLLDVYRANLAMAPQATA